MTSLENPKTQFQRSGDVMQLMTSLGRQSGINVIPAVTSHYNPTN